MDKKNTVSARIFGSEYTLVGTESVEYITKVCSEVDEKMRSIAKSPSANPLKTSVLCSVNLCDEKLKCEEKLKNAQNSLKAAADRIADLKTNEKVLREENDYLKDEIRSLKHRLAGKTK